MDKDERRAEGRYEQVGFHLRMKELSFTNSSHKIRRYKEQNRQQHLTHLVLPKQHGLEMDEERQDLRSKARRGEDNPNTNTQRGMKQPRKVQQLSKPDSVW